MQNKKTSMTTESFVRRHRPLFVSLFVIIPILLIPVMLIFTIIRSDRLQQWCTLHAMYENSQGLKRGNQVSMSGMAIGHVRNVELIREGLVHVSFDINSRYTHLVRQDTRVRMRQRGFVGDWELELTGGSATAREARDNDTLQSERVSTLDDMISLAIGVVDTAMIILNSVANIAKGIEDGEGTIGQVLKNDALFRNINNTAADMSQIAANVNVISRDMKGTVTLVDSLVLSFTDAGKNTTAAIDTLTGIFVSANAMVDSVRVEIDAILKNLRTVSDDTPQIINRLMDDIGEVEAMLRNFQEGRVGNFLFGSVPDNPNLSESP